MMERSDIVIRELRQDESHEVRELILTGLFRDTLTLQNTFGLMSSRESCLWMATVSTIFYMLSHSVVLSALLPPFVAFLASLGYLWGDYRQYVLESQSEIQDLYAWYANMSDRKFWVALYRQEVIGSVALQKTSETVAELKKMSVHYKYRRQGVGKLMVKYLEDYCRSVGIREVFMSTSNFGHGHRLYQRCGYVIKAEFLRRIVPLPGAWVTILQLAKEL
ncbi:Hypp8060 [Branchiostoma lanceolatum]|uniref:Hypp8060 protein n=1 Tax=Branchiostoma lanceolatum TaxID=7740 RepID=A0A8K0ECH0_BRALA|nr:Hypp8060 [Branchiostoma lanceolatum]